MKRPSKQFVGTLLLLLIMGATVLLVVFGSPQTHKYLYIVQDNISPWHPEVPTSYTGVWKTWYPDGTLRSRGTYANGLRQGRYTGWDGQGRKQFDATYNAERVDGFLERWHWDSSSGSGFPWMIQHYQAGNPHGSQVSYYSNGQADTLEHFNNGKRTGKTIKWDRNGRIVFEATYLDGLEVIDVTNLLVNQGASPLVPIVPAHLTASMAQTNVTETLIRSTYGSPAKEYREPSGWTRWVYEYTVSGNATKCICRFDPEADLCSVTWTSGHEIPLVG